MPAVHHHCTSGHPVVRSLVEGGEGAHERQGLETGGGGVASGKTQYKGTKNIIKAPALPRSPHLQRRIACLFLESPHRPRRLPRIVRQPQRSWCCACYNTSRSRIQYEREVRSVECAGRYGCQVACVYTCVCLFRVYCSPSLGREVVSSAAVLTFSLLQGTWGRLGAAAGKGTVGRRHYPVRPSSNRAWFSFLR